MIYTQTLNSLTEDEYSILFYICQRVLEPLNIDARFEFIKMLRLDITCKIIDTLQKQALDDKQEIFTSLKKKLTE
jgi:hypothetical protein